jgi:hypothetical protein
MTGNDELKTIDKGMKTLTIIWAAMLISLATYMFVGIYATSSFSTSMDEKILKIIRNVLYLVSIVTLVATKYIRNIILRSKLTESHQGAKFRHPALSKYSTAMIVSLALSESIGIYGLVLAFLGGNTTDLYLLVFIAAAATVYYRPKKEEVVGLAKQLKKSQYESNKSL